MSKRELEPRDKKPQFRRQRDLGVEKSLCVEVEGSQTNQSHK